MQEFIDYLFKYAQLVRITDVIDIVIVAVIIYYILKTVKETRAKQLLKGIAIIFIIFFASQWLRLNALNYIMSATLQVGVFALVVIFQPELRNLLEKVGRITFGKFIDFGGDSTVEEMEMTIESVVKAACDMSETKTGALIVIEQETQLGEYIQTGTSLNSDVTSMLLENIFVPNTPLHDGAVIIRGNKIITAACLLPLTANINLSRELGTRHRAAIGLSEVTDAIVVVVSEETGKISIAREGTLTRNLHEDSLRNALRKALIFSRMKDKKTETIEKFKFWRSK